MSDPDLQPLRDQRSSSILRTSVNNQANKASSSRRKRRTSFSEDLHREDAPIRNASGLMEDSVGTSQGTESENDNNDAKRPSWSKLLSKIARPQQTSIPIATRMSSSTEISSSLLNAASSTSPALISRCCGPSQGVLDFIKKFLNSTVWNILVLFFTFTLLFGSHLQWFFPGEADVYFTFIYAATLVVLLADMGLTAYTENFYFRVYWKSRKDFRFGSFLFWFDLFSVMSILAVPLIWGANTEPKNISIAIQDGDPIGLQKIQGSPFNMDMILFWTVIARTARVARFLRIASVLNFATKTRSIWMKLLETVKKYCAIPLNCSKVLCKCLWSENKSRRRHYQKASRSSSFLDAGNIESLKGEDNQAAARIQRSWRTYRDTESVDKPGRLDRPQSASAQAERIARLKKRRRSSTTPRPNKTDKMLAKNDRKELRRRRRQLVRSSQIGLRMYDRTTKRVAIGIIISMVCTLLFTIHEPDMTSSIMMVSLHNSMVSLCERAIDKNQISLFDKGADFFAETARNSSAQNLIEIDFSYKQNNTDVCIYKRNFATGGISETGEIEIINVTENNAKTTGRFDTLRKHYGAGIASLVFTFFILFIWFLGLLMFAGPVTTLVVIPIERMIRLLSMLVKDPLGYDTTEKYKCFASEEEELAAHTSWTKENLKGMETSFLQSTILRIGSLMKVGFGAAGVQIIRGSLRNATGSNVTFRQSHQASTVSCIFLFCDIRQFTDASECLQEEVFLFTNKIAAVVHSICHSFGGFANKNIGDAFLVSWKLDEVYKTGPAFLNGNELYAQDKQADKALYSVVQICMALCHESFFLEDISDDARKRLQNKFESRSGNLVQLGFGLHAGKAVEGAIGSPRKLDATYLSNAVELAEFLESSTKKYGVSILMSGSFYHLLHASNQRRCRQVDEAFFADEYEEEFDEDLFEIPEEESESFMRLYTFDFDLEALRHQNDNRSETQSVDVQSLNMSVQSSDDLSGSNRRSIFNTSQRRKKPGMLSFRRLSIMGARHAHDSVPENVVAEFPDEVVAERKGRLTLPSGPVHYTSSLWKTDNITTIRQKYTPTFFHKFQLGFNSYLKGDWRVARSNFEFMEQRYDDQPSKVFLKKMKNTNYIPPRNFRWRLGRA